MLWDSMLRLSMLRYSMLWHSTLSELSFSTMGFNNYLLRYLEHVPGLFDASWVTSALVVGDIHHRRSPGRADVSTGLARLPEVWPQAADEELAHVDHHLVQPSAEQKNYEDFVKWVDKCGQHGVPGVSRRAGEQQAEALDWSELQKNIWSKCCWMWKWMD